MFEIVFLILTISVKAIVEQAEDKLGRDLSNYMSVVRRCVRGHMDDLDEH